MPFRQETKYSTLSPQEIIIMNKYIIYARSWGDGLKKRFGEEYSTHELTDAQVIEAIISFGRASIILFGDASSFITSSSNCTADSKAIEFQNDYD